MQQLGTVLGFFIVSGMCAVVANIRGYRVWQWLFIGAFSMIFGIVALFILPNARNSLTVSNFRRNLLIVLWLVFICVLFFQRPQLFVAGLVFGIISAVISHRNGRRAWVWAMVGSVVPVFGFLELLRQLPAVKDEM